MILHPKAWQIRSSRIQPPLYHRLKRRKTMTVLRKAAILLSAVLCACAAQGGFIDDQSGVGIHHCVSWYVMTMKQKSPHQILLFVFISMSVGMSFGMDCEWLLCGAHGELNESMHAHIRTSIKQTLLRWSQKPRVICSSSSEGMRGPPNPEERPLVALTLDDRCPLINISDHWYPFAFVYQTQKDVD